MRGKVMLKKRINKFDRLNSENQELATAFIDMLSRRQSKKNRELTIKVIKEADAGINLSEPFDNLDDLMTSLNA